MLYSTKWLQSTKGQQNHRKGKRRISPILVSSLEESSDSVHLGVKSVSLVGRISPNDNKLLFIHCVFMFAVLQCPDHLAVVWRIILQWEFDGHPKYTKINKMFINQLRRHYTVTNSSFKADISFFLSLFCFFALFFLFSITVISASVYGSK